MKMDSSASLMPNGGTSGKQKRGSNTNGAIPNNKSSSGVLPSVNYHRFSESAHFANIMVEFENDTREMAVDVPDSFIATTKTPPKYPPPMRLNGNSSGHSSFSSNHNSASNGNIPSRSHLRIEPDGYLLNTREGPTPPARNGTANNSGSSGGGGGSRSSANSSNRSFDNQNVDPYSTPQGQTGTGYMRPTEQQSLRMKKYSEDIKRRNMELEKKQRTDEFLRQSIRNSQKMRALKHQEQQQNNQTMTSTPILNNNIGGGVGLNGVVNGAFQRSPGNMDESITTTLSSMLSQAHQEKSSPMPQLDLVGFAHLLKRLDKAGSGLRNEDPDLSAGLSEIANQMTGLLENKEFRNAYNVNQKIHEEQIRHSPDPAAIDSRQLVEDAVKIVAKLADSEEEARELTAILNGGHTASAAFKSLLQAHDEAGERRLAIKEAQAQAQHEDTMDSSRRSKAGGSRRNNGFVVADEEALMGRLSQYSEPNIKIVRIEKTNEPLGATVKNEDDAVVVSRIIRGGTAEASGLLHEGDEILEVNEVPLRGKNVNEVCDILAQMQGTLTMLVVPTRNHLAAFENGRPQPVMHIKAHIDYDPEDDPYLPCRELGISFVKGDILHVINQKDPNWWQARRDGEEDIALPGLVPSASFLQQREAVKNTIAADMNDRYANGELGYRAKTSTGSFLCAKRSGRNRANKHKHKKHGTAPRQSSKTPFSADDNDASDAAAAAGDIITYEEVALYYPRSDRKRPVVLIGPPNIGRHELRQRLMQDGERFAAAIPHTSRPKRPDEVDGQDYHFINRQSFEQDILSRRFVEHGEYEKSYYGTSLEAIRSVILSEKICVLNLHPQSLRILKNSDLMPFIVFVAPPSMEKLKRWKLDRSEPVADEELKDIIERARDMEETYGHFFDMIIVYSDPERSYHELLRAINVLEREPQWVPASWLQRKSNYY